MAVYTYAGDLVMSEAITGSCWLTKDGPELLVLAHTNSYTGLTELNEGDLALRAPNALGAAGAGNETFVRGAQLWLESTELLSETIVFRDALLQSTAVTGGISGPVFLEGPLQVHTPVPGRTLTLASSVSGFGMIRKTGSGTLVVDGTFGVEALDATEGTTLFNAASELAAVGASGGRLGGVGQSAVLFGTGGVIAPGPAHGPGILTAKLVSLGADVTLSLDLQSATAGSGHDQLRALETVEINNAGLSVSLGFAPPAHTPFVIIRNDGTEPVQGTFADLPQGSPFPAGDTQLYLSYTGGDGNDVVLSTSPPLFTRYFAEGAANSFFATRIAVLNPDAEPAEVTLRLLGQNGAQTTIARTVGAKQRTTFELTPEAGLPDATFSTVVESTRPVVADRLMTWDGTGYGSTLESSIDSPGLTWYLAEGATGSYSLYYLLQNPGAQAARVQVMYLLPAPRAPITIEYDVLPHSRHTIDVAGEHPSLAATEVSAKITSTQPIVVERAMYAHLPGQFQAGGHDGAAQPAPATRWFLAEGATGFFDEYVLIANAESTEAPITATFLLEGAGSFADTFTVGANSRYTLDLKRYPQLQATPVSVIIESSDAPVVVERVMWWPSGQPWYETSLSAGVTQTGTRWGIAEGEVGGPFNSSTYVLLANTDPTTAGSATVTLHYEDGTSESTVVELPPNSRRTVDASALPSAAGKRFGVIVQSDGIPILVERSFFSTIEGGGMWTAGATSVATNLSVTP